MRADTWWIVLILLVFGAIGCTNTAATVKQLQPSSTAQTHKVAHEHHQHRRKDERARRDEIKADPHPACRTDEAVPPGTVGVHLLVKLSSKARPIAICTDRAQALFIRFVNT